MRGRTIPSITIFLSILSGCIFDMDNKNPLLENKAFDIIGDQGIKESITLIDLKGDYTGKLWFEELENYRYSEKEYDCHGKIDGNEMSIVWEMNGLSNRFGEGIPFSLEDGILISDENPDPRLICAVKTYPSGQMVDCLASTEIVDSKDKFPVKIHFQLIK